MEKAEYLSLNQSIIKDKIVLDLACHSGESTKLIQQLGSGYVYAVEGRKALIDIAKQIIQHNAQFIVGDITDKETIMPLVAKSQSVICLGVFYHLYDHFRFLQYILQPHIEYCLIETLFGPESMNPEMHWGFENTESKLHGLYRDLPIIPHGTPNLSWIINSAKIFGFECDWVHCYGNKLIKSIEQITSEEYLTVAGTNWPSYQEIITNENIPTFVLEELQQMLYDYPITDRRMILRLYNKNLKTSKPIDLKDYFKWPL